MAQEQGIPVIGETSGGGTCVLTKLSYPGAVGYSLSGNKIMIYENGKNTDAGAAVNYENTVPYSIVSNCVNAAAGADINSGIKISFATVNINGECKTNVENKKSPHIQRMIKPIINKKKRAMLNLKPFVFVIIISPLRLALFFLYYIRATTTASQQKKQTAGKKQSADSL